jgi:hypothetical protein
MTCNYSKVCYDYPDKFSLQTHGADEKLQLVRFAKFYAKHTAEVHIIWLYIP